MLVLKGRSLSEENKGELLETWALLSLITEKVSESILPPRSSELDLTETMGIGRLEAGEGVRFISSYLMVASRKLRASSTPCCTEETRLRSLDMTM